MRNYFTDKELACKCCGKIGPGIEAIRYKLNILRHFLGRPIIVTSGYRCPAHNARVGGAKASRHLIDAVDFRVPEYSMDQVYTICEASPVLSMGGLAYKKGAFIHMDCGKKRRWEYR